MKRNDTWIAPCLAVAILSHMASALAEETIKVGWLSSLTGPLSSAAIAENQGVRSGSTRSTQLAASRDANWNC
jgi:branched-chain amino acid transport system substrate-binding protein